MKRDDICPYLGSATRAQLEALLTDRNTPRKGVWRAGIRRTTADRCALTSALTERANFLKEVSL